MSTMPDSGFRQTLLRGVVIPASPLALDAERRLDERRQRALWRYYGAAGAGGIAIGVHTTQFAIRDPKIGLYRPMLELAREEFDRAAAHPAMVAEKGGKPADRDEERIQAEKTLGPMPRPLVRIAGICGTTAQAVEEASLARGLGYHAGLVSLGALSRADEAALLAHCRAVAEVLPVFGFYLQPAVGGRVLPYTFWRRLLEIEAVVAIKVAPFNRYQTLDVARALAESGRGDVALYTGNDDNILADLLTPFRFRTPRGEVEVRMAGGLLGQWAVWTHRAVELLARCRAAAERHCVGEDLLRMNVALTDANAALFDAAHGFAGCIPGIHEVLRRQGLLEGITCLDPHETLSPGQAEEIDRVLAAYPHLTDDAFVAEHRDAWLAG